MADTLPDRARVVVVGGGIAGASVAYPPDQAGLDGRRRPGAQAADRRDHLARRRPGHPASGLSDSDRAGQRRRQPVRDAGGRDGKANVLQADRQHHGGPYPGANGRAQAHRLAGARVRYRDTRDNRTGGRREAAADRHRRYRGRHLHPEGRPGRPGGRCDGDGRRRRERGRVHLRGDQGHRHPAEERRRLRRLDRKGRHRVRVRRQLRRDVGQGGRPHVRRRRAAAGRRAHVPRPPSPWESQGT